MPCAFALPRLDGTVRYRCISCLRLLRGEPRRFVPQCPHCRFPQSYDRNQQWCIWICHCCDTQNPAGAQICHLCAYEYGSDCVSRWYWPVLDSWKRPGTEEATVEEARKMLVECTLVWEDLLQEEGLKTRRGYVNFHQFWVNRLQKMLKEKRYYKTQGTSTDKLELDTAKTKP